MKILATIAAAGLPAAGFASAPALTPAHATGCIKGAIVGGAACHFAHHHGLPGAGAGCLIGHHLAAKKGGQQPNPQNR